MAPLRLPHLPGPAAARQPGARAAPAGAALLQPVGRRAEARGLAASARFFLDQPIGPGKGLQALVGDGLAADHRLAVGALLDALLGAADRLPPAPQVGTDRVAPARLVQVIPLVTPVLRLFAGLVRANPGELALDPRPLLGEPLPCVFGVHCR